ncbi:MAG: LamG domain-containing protein, partial [Nitrospira sp.]|nr:LamG domain-containing protein [Nitrospira sp.]
LIVHGSSGLTSNCVVTEGRWDARATFTAASAQTHLTNPDLVLRADLAGFVRDVLHVTGLPASPFTFEGESLNRFTLRLTTPPSEPLTVELFPGLSLAGMPDKILRLNPVSGNTIDFTVSSEGTFLLVAKLAQSLNLGAAGVFAAGAEVRIDQTGASISGQIANASATLVVGAQNNQITTTLSGSLVLPRIVALGGRVILASPQGGDLMATTGPEGTCVSGAELTLQNFAPNTTPLRIAFPAFCLDASRAFRDLSPSAAEATPTSEPSLLSVRYSTVANLQRLALSSPASTLRRLPVGAFQLDNLGSLRLTGDFNARTLSLSFDSQLNLGSLLSLPIRGSVGTAGLRFSSTSASLRLLGHDFSAIRLGITNTLGDLPAVSFAGRLANLPPPFNTLELGGLIPGTGDFTLTPPASVPLPSLIPSFPLNDALPSFAYRTAPYTDIVRSDLPSGFWPLEDIDDKVEDQRLASFSTSTPRRNGTRLGTRLPSQPGALADTARRSMAFDGSTAWVRWSQPELTPTPDGFTASLWFKRAAGRTGVPILTSPQTLAGRAHQWSLRLQGTTTTGTRLHWAIDGLQTPNGSPLPALSSRTRIDDAEWHLVVAVYDGAAQYLYLDGRLDAWQLGQGTLSIPANADTSLAARSEGNRVTEYF